MNFRRHIFCPGRVMATLAGLGVAWSVAAGDAIIFSKPAIPLAAPPKEESNLPEIRERGMNFSTPTFEQAPVAPPRQPLPMMRDEPRDLEREQTHPLLRTPRIFTDPDEEKARKESLKEARNNPFAPTTEKKLPGSPFMRDMDNQMRSDQTRSLAPITDLDWQPGEPLNGKQEPKRGGMGTGRPLTRQDESSFGSEYARPNPLFDFSNNRSQEKLSPSQIQRRTDFEQLLNPNAGLAGKAPNSLQPVINAADAKPAALAMPTLNGNGFDSRSADPMAALNRQQERLRGPVIEDVNKRYNNTSANEQKSSTTANRPSLLREPPSREFPTRKF
jgi:hypothetical protein